MKSRWIWLLALVGGVALIGAIVIPSAVTNLLWRPLPAVENLAWLLALSMQVVVGLFMWVRWPKLPTGRSLYLAGVLGLTSFALFIPQTKVLSDAIGLASVMMTIQALLTYPDGKLTTWAHRLLMLGWAGLIAGGGLAIFTQDPRPEFCADCPRPWPLIVDVPALTGLTFWVAFLSVTIVTVAAGMLFAMRWIRGSRPTRRALSPVLFLSAGPGVLRMLVFLAGSGGLILPFPSSVSRISGYLLVLYPIGFLWGALRTRLALLEAADLLGDLDGQIQIGEVQPLLRQRLSDPGLEIGFWRPIEHRYAQADGSQLIEDDGRVATELRRDDRPYAIVLHDPVLDRATVEAVGSIIGMALENERLHSELRAHLEEVRASRRRIVVAADEARYQVERDLHDGAQQRLVALGLNLEMIANELDGQASESATVHLNRAREEARAAIKELRDLSRGLHPVALAEAGLRPAISALADRSPLPIETSVVEGRWPEPVEQAAYYVVAESMTNIAKHAGASAGYVEVAETDSQLVVTVSDDGVGGASPDHGTGLQGLIDRVDALGGRISVSSPAGKGTKVVTVLPCG